MADILLKYTDESRLYDIDFTALLDGDTIASITEDPVATGITVDPGSVAINNTEITYGDGKVAPIGSAVQFRVAQESTVGYYTFNCLVLTTLGNTLRGSVVLEVI